jgi:hypothetical protein
VESGKGQRNPKEAANGWGDEWISLSLSSILLVLSSLFYPPNVFSLVTLTLCVSLSFVSLLAKVVD